MKTLIHKPLSLITKTRNRGLDAFNRTSGPCSCGGEVEGSSGREVAVKGGGGQNGLQLYSSVAVFVNIPFVKCLLFMRDWSPLATNATS